MTISAIVQRGHEDGTLRPDVTGRTIVQFGAMLARPMSNVQGWADIAARAGGISTFILATDDLVTLENFSSLAPEAPNRVESQRNT